jgi:hypothetical protein
VRLPCRQPAKANAMRGPQLVAIALCALVALSACRREESYEPLKLGGPATERLTR